MMVLTLLSPHAGTNREENPSRIHEIGGRDFPKVVGGHFWAHIDL